MLNLTNVLKYSNVNVLNFKPLVPKQLIWARQLGTEIVVQDQQKNTRARVGYARVRRTRVQERAIRGHKRDTHSGAEYTCGSGIRVWELDAHFGAEYPCGSGIGLRKWDSVRE